MVPVSSGFVIPPAILPEEIPPVAETFLTQTPVAELTTGVSAVEPSASAVVVYKPPPPAETPLEDETWVKTQKRTY